MLSGASIGNHAAIRAGSGIPAFAVADVLAVSKRDRGELAAVCERLNVLLRRGLPGESIDPNRPFLFPG